MKTNLYLMLVLGLSFNLVAQSNSQLLENYLGALKGSMHGGSTSADIEKLTDLYSDNITYEHPKFGMQIQDKSEVSKGLNAFLKSYGGTIADVRLDLSNQLVGEQAIAIQFQIRFLTAD